MPALPDLLLKDGRVVDADGERRADVRVHDGLITEVAPELVPADGESVLDAAGCVVSPGFVDLHVHLREPGDEEAETIETGTRAAAREASPRWWRCPTRARRSTTPRS